jgi:hypothetical protein
MAQDCSSSPAEEQVPARASRFPRLARDLGRAVVRLAVVFTAIGGFVQSVQLVEAWLDHLHL